MSYGGNDDSKYGSSRNDEDSYGSSRNNDDSYGSTARRDNEDSYGSSRRLFGSSRRDNDDSYGSSNPVKHSSFGDSTSSNLAGADSLSYNASDNKGRTYDNDPTSYGSNDSYGLSRRKDNDNDNDNDDSFGSSTRRENETTAAPSSYGTTGRNEDSYGSSGPVGRAGSDSYGSGGRDENDSCGSSRNDNSSSSRRDDDDTYGGSDDKGGDSKLGKVLEKAGSMFHSEKLENKGYEKREAKGAYGGNNDY